MDQFYDIATVFPEILVHVSLFIALLALYYLISTKCEDYTSNQSDNNGDSYELKTKMTKYENKTSASNIIPLDKSFVIRIDGLRSRGLLRKLKEIAKEDDDSPHSKEMVDAMIETAYDLQTYFRPSAIYVNSNEFLLFFPSSTYRPKYGKKREQLYCGQVTKLLSLASSVATYNFNRHLVEQFAGTPRENDAKTFAGYHFQSKIVSFDSDELLNIAKYLVWRAVGICNMSCRTMYAAYYLGKYEISNFSEQEREIKLAEKGVTYDNVDDAIRYGLFLRGKDLFTVTDLRPSQFLADFLLDELQWDLNEFEEFYTVFTHEFYKNSDNTDNTDNADNTDSVDQFSEAFSAFNDVVPDLAT